jgi:microcystin-dependent protein
MNHHSSDFFRAAKNDGKFRRRKHRAVALAHSHVPQAALGATGNPANSPANNVWSGWTGGGFSAQAPSVNLNAAAIGVVGGSQPHDNLAPYQTINFVISLFGVFPSQN